MGASCRRTFSILSRRWRRGRPLPERSVAGAGPCGGPGGLPGSWGSPTCAAQEFARWWSAPAPAASSGTAATRAGSAIPAAFRATVEAMRAGSGSSCDLLFDCNSPASIRRGRGLLEAGYPSDGHVDVVSARPTTATGQRATRKEGGRCSGRSSTTCATSAPAAASTSPSEWGAWNEALGPSSGANGHHVEMICR